MTKAIYPGSFDPVTFGHLDIIRRAAQAFDELVVAVGRNSSKKYLFDERTRVELIEMEIRRLGLLKPVKVVAFNGLLADFAYEVGANIIVKGVRPGARDFDYETMLHQISITQQRGVDTHILIAKEELSHVSSSAVRELALHQGLLHEYVPLRVKQELEMLTPQLIVGLTGSIASGKSYIMSQMEKLSGHAGYSEIHHVDLDKIAHEILDDSPETPRKEGVYQELRGKIADHFKLPKIDRYAIGNIVFNYPEERAWLNNILRVPILTRVRREIGQKKGIVFLNGALLVEAGYLPICNNIVVVIKADRDVQLKRLKARGLNSDQIERRLESQFTSEQKITAVKEAIDREMFGRLFVVDNSTAPIKMDISRKCKYLLAMLCLPHVERNRGMGLFWEHFPTNSEESPEVYERR